MFNEFIRMNITEQQLAKIQSTVKPFCMDMLPKLINKEEIIKINDADGQTLIGYSVIMKIPEKYKKKKIIAKVTIEGIVNKSGRLVNSRVTKNTGSEILEPAAIELGEKLLFEPATIDCEIADFEVSFDFNFILDDSFEMKN
jgi:TonB family protein